MAELTIRPYRAGDRGDVGRICLLTGAAGQDASGVFAHDSLLADVYALPYVDRDPELAFVVDDDGRAVGYVIGTDDTEAFNAWFRDEWWPRAATAYTDVVDVAPDSGVLENAAALGRERVPYSTQYPAHLHIDLLPEAQGGGFGRRLITALCDALRARGVSGVHLVAAAENAGAVAFYTRLGFTPLPADDGARAFGMRLD